MKDFSHLTGQDCTQQQDTLLVLTTLAEEWKQRKQAVEEAERVLKAAKAAFNKVSQEDIPNTMIDAGLSEIKLSDGSKVAFKEDVSCSVKDYRKLQSFLTERGEEGMLKITLEIGNVPSSILNMILRDLSEKYELSAVPKQFVHPATMAAYVRRLCGINGVCPTEIPVSALDDTMLSVYSYYKTTIK